MFENDSGLRILKSMFKSPCGSRGVVEGPHPKFSEVESKVQGNHVRSSDSYFVEPVQIIRSRWKCGLGVPLLGVERASHLPNPDFPVCCSRLDSVDKEILSFPECGDAHSSVKDSSLSTSAVAEHTPVEILSPDILSFVCPACAHVGRRPLKSIKEYDAWEQTGTEVTFRCPECKECLKCKNGPRLESISIQEEVEEALISRCVTVDLKRGVSLAKLPFLVDPDIRINDDEQRAVA